MQVSITVSKKSQVDHSEPGEVTLKFIKYALGDDWTGQQCGISGVVVKSYQGVGREMFERFFSEESGTELG